MQTWYVAEDGRSQGPFTVEEIRRKLASGECGRSSLVWQAGMGDWTPLGQIPEFASGGTAIEPTPPPSVGPPPVSGQEAHEVDYEIFGHEMQFVEIELDPGESAVAEAGAMMYMTDGIGMETVFGDGSARSEAGGFLGKMVGAGKRLITGESLFCTLFSHRGASGKAKVAFAAPYPGKILALDLKDYQGELVCQKDSFLCAAKGVSLGVAFQKRLGVGLFGGEGFIMQKLEGDGLVFVHAGGTLVEKNLEAGETLRVDTGCLVALTRTVDYDIEFVGNVKSAIFGGEGFFFATLRGPGHVWLQSLPFSRLAGRIYQAMPQGGNQSQGEGSVLGGFGRLFQD